MTLNDELIAHAAALEATVSASTDTVEAIVSCLSTCFADGGKVLICGNGGSAADAQHLAAEFMNRLRLDRQPLAAIALTTDTSVLTCVANDRCYDEVFSRQVEALGRGGDVLVALSTSGRSANVLEALAAGRRLGLTTIGLTSGAGAEWMAAACDLLVAVPSADCARIQECHEFVCHAIAGMVEGRLFGDAAPEERAAG